MILREELRSIAKFIRGVGEEIPWHVSAFSPMYKLFNLSRTPASALKLARDIGIEEGLRYVYMGNVPAEHGEDTCCYKCGEKLIRRYGYEILSNRVEDSKCPICESKIDGIGMG